MSRRSNNATREAIPEAIPRNPGRPITHGIPRNHGTHAEHRRTPIISETLYQPRGSERSSSLKALTTRREQVCSGPMCKKPILPPESGWRRTERLFCSSRCRMDAWVIKRAAELYGVTVAELNALLTGGKVPAELSPSNRVNACACDACLVERE
jgi:hypothetical protein